MSAMLVSGLTGRAKVANGTYRVVPGELQHRRPVYRQADVASSRGASRLVYDKTPGETPAWMVELPDDPGKAYAYCEDRVRTPDAAAEVWHVWECEITTPIEDGKWSPRPGFRVVAVPERREPVRARGPAAGAPASRPPDRRPAPPGAHAPASIELRGHRYAEFNGVYAHAGDCEGFPYYSSQTGKHLFRPVGHTPELKQWLLASALNPRDNQCETYIECADKTPPLGRQRWQIWDQAMRRWAGCELELTEDHVARIASTARDRRRLDEYALSIGIDPATETHLMWIAEKGFRAPLPAGWSERVDSMTGEVRYVEVFRGGASQREQQRHPAADGYRDLAERTRLEHAAGETQGTGFNRTISTGAAAAAVASAAGGADGGLSRTLSGGLAGGGNGEAEAEDALAMRLSMATMVEDDRRREDKRRLAAEDAVAMGFAPDLVASVQAEGQFDAVDALVERLAELTRGEEPEPEREEDFDGYSGAGPTSLALNWAGLPNPSNYCFLNATVQCLRHTPGFANALSSAVGEKGGSKWRGKPASLLEGFVLLLRRMEDTDGTRGRVHSKSREWEDFIAQCKEQLPSEPDEDGQMTTLVHLKRQPQQDAGEFLLQLLDQLSQDRVGGNDKANLVLGRRNSLAVEELDPSYGDQMAARLTRAKSSPEAERLLLEEYIEKQWRATKDTTRRTHIGALFQGQELTYKLCNKPGCGLFSPSSADPVLVEELHCSHLASRDRATLDEVRTSHADPPYLTHRRDRSLLRARTVHSIQ
eukprot:COSAG06_NODE_673_length_13189_cov_211.299312_3_plen_763_part_00